MKHRIADRLFRKFGPRYILVMMVVTRIFGSVGGLLVVYYTEFTLQMPWTVRLHFRISSAVVVVISCSLTVLLALWETRTLRSVLARFRTGRSVDPDTAVRAGREAVVFVNRHHAHEAWLVPCTTLVPVLIFLKVVDDASSAIMMNITAAVFMGIAMALMSTYFVIEHCMQPVIRDLLQRGVRIDYDRLPKNRLRFRFRTSFILIILTTALMIGTLARQRTSDIIAFEDHDRVIQAVRALRTHSTLITVAAVITGMAYSSILANSVANRAGRLVKAMERVGDGHLAERVQPTGNDEIDVLGRQFNTMVDRLQQNDEVIRDLNTNLERKVQERTNELELALQKLRDAQAQLTDVAHQAGMAETATGVLHNVGNVLNSVNISAALVSERLRNSRLKDFERFTERLNAQGDDLETFLTGARAPKLLEYLNTLVSRLAEERDEFIHELEGLNEKIGHIKSAISAQQNLARRVHFREEVVLPDLVRDVLEMHAPSFERHRVGVATRLDDVPPAFLEKNKLVQVMDNLVRNAVESIKISNGPERRLTVDLERLDPERVRMSVSDTGTGVDPEHAKRIFTYGFTTKPTGNGFGLHSSALAMSELGGTIQIHSDGPGQGAVFTLEFPLGTDRDASEGGVDGEANAGHATGDAESSVQESLVGEVV